MKRDYYLSMEFYTFLPKSCLPTDSVLKLNLSTLKNMIFYESFPECKAACKNHLSLKKENYTKLHLLDRLETYYILKCDGDFKFCDLLNALSQIFSSGLNTLQLSAAIIFSSEYKLDV